MMMNETNEIDIFSMGYGHIAKLVMKDKDLTVEAKAIYSYIASYAGASDTAYPSEYCEQIEPPVRMIEPASAINRATQCNRESH